MKTRVSAATKNRSRRGQSLIEYILMVAMLSILSAGFAKFYQRGVLGEGFRRLPAKVSPCISHGNDPEACQ